MEQQEKRIVIVGAGIMGASLSQVYAQGGWQVTLYNRSESGLARAAGTMEKNWETLCAQGLLTAQAAQEAQGRITPTTDRGCMAQCDLMLETIVEDLETKQAFWTEASRLAPEDALLATNTSRASSGARRRTPCWPPTPAACPSAGSPRQCTGRSGSWASTGSIRPTCCRCARSSGETRRRRRISSGCTGW